MLRLAEHLNLVAFLLGLAGLAVHIGRLFREAPAGPLEAVSVSVGRLAAGMAVAGWLALPAAFAVADAPPGHMARVLGFTFGISVAAVSSRLGAGLERRGVAAGRPATSGRTAMRRVALFFSGVALVTFLAFGGVKLPGGVIAIGAVCALAGFAAGEGKPARSMAVRITCFAGASAALAILAWAGARAWAPRMGAGANGAVTGAAFGAVVLGAASWIAAWRSGRGGAVVADTFRVVGLAAALGSALALSGLADRASWPV